MIPNRSLAARQAKSVFFEEINDIDIYIEDTAHGYEKLFTLLFSRVFEGQYRVRKVFPLGGRKSVVDAHRSFSTNGRPTLFVVDGDLFILTGDDVRSHNGLFRVPFYCIENIICDPNAIYEIMNEEDPISMKEELIDLFDYRNWVVKNEDALFRLFVEYAITFLLNPEKQNVSFPVSNLVSSNEGCVDKYKVERRIRELSESAISKVGSRKYKEVKRNIYSKFYGLRVSEVDVISGKDYLFPLFKMRIRKIVKTKASDINIKIRLALKCDVSRLEGVRDLVLC